jgi:hypothetical protein
LDYPEEFTILLVNHSNTGARIPTLISGRHGSIEIGPARTPAGWPHEPTSDLRLKAESDFAREFKEKNDNYGEVEIMLEPHRDIMGVSWTQFAARARSPAISTWASRRWSGSGSGLRHSGRTKRSCSTRRRRRS